MGCSKVTVDAIPSDTGRECWVESLAVMIHEDDMGIVGKLIKNQLNVPGGSGHE